MVPLERADVSSDGNTLVGYASTFNDWADIDSWEGEFRERIDPKAFDKTLAESGSRVKVLFNHGFDPQIGDKPLGKPSVMEPRARGLWTETPLDETSYNGDLKVLLKSGALDGMSFRFSVIQDEWADGDDGVEERTIKEVKLYEFGPVTFPAYEATTAGVRNAGSFKLWRSTHRDGENKTQAVPSAEEDRSTDKAAASAEEDRDTSAIETWKATALLLRQDAERQREENPWQPQES
jgi:hypothetical protein